MKSGILKKVRSNISHERYVFFFLLGIVLLFSRVFFQHVFFPTHDLEYHIIRLWQFEKIMYEGIWIPRWAPDLNKGYGIPLFTFMYPLPNYIGMLFRISGFSLIKSVYFTLFLGFAISGFTFYIWAREHASVFPSLIGAVYYLTAPYHLLDVYIRGSVGEVWAFAIFPLALYLIIKCIRYPNIHKIIYFFLSIILSILIITHTILGTLFFVLSGVYAVYQLLLNKKSITLLLKLFSIYLMALVYVAWFIIPIIFQWHLIKGITQVNALDHFPAIFQLLFPSWGSGFSVPGIRDALSFQIGIPHLIIILLFVLFAIRKKCKTIGFFWFFTICISLFLMLDISRFVWEEVVLLQYFQFPWRFLSVVILASSFLAVLVASRMRTFFNLFLFILPFLFYYRYSMPVVYRERDDTFYLNNPHWTEGTATVGNSFNTIWFNRLNSKTFSRKPAFTGKLERLLLIANTSTKKVFKIDSLENGLFYPHIAYYPGWNVYIDGYKGLLINKEGEIALPLIKGKHIIVVQFDKMPVTIVSEYISLIGFSVSSIYLLYTIYENRH